MSVGEFDIIEKYFKQLTHSRDDVLVAIGDDCALMLPDQGKLLAVTTDTLVAGTHFFEDTDPFKLGHKCLAVNLSDLAAMGADPSWVSLALTLPEVNEDWLTSFAKGFAALANQFNVQLIGGDTTKGPLSITLTAHGQVQPGRVLTRAGASKDDLVYISGQLGSAAMALKKYFSEDSIIPAELENALLAPEPRVQLGQLLTGLATSCIDISDGLLADLGHVCDASACGAEIHLEKLPCHPLVTGEIQTSGNWELPLSGGDDYELCFTIPPSLKAKFEEITRDSDLQLTQIGKITESARVEVFDESGKIVDLVKHGYTHF